MEKCYKVEKQKWFYFLQIFTHLIIQAMVSECDSAEIKVMMRKQMWKIK